VHIHTPAAIGTALMHARLPRNADARARTPDDLSVSWRREIRLRDSTEHPSVSLAPSFAVKSLLHVAHRYS